MKMEEVSSIESVLEYVLPYIPDGDDRNSISLVSHKFYELDCITRKHLTVHLPYAQNPSALTNRFPFIHSLSLKGLPHKDLDVLTPWIKQISVNSHCLKALRIRSLVVSDQDLQLLATTRGKDLRSLKICSCQGFSEKGLVHVSRCCNHLTSLCFKYDEMNGDHTGEWLRELALRKTPIQSLHFRLHFTDVFNNFNVEDLTFFARSCSNSLVSLKIEPIPLNHLRDVFSHAIKLHDVNGAIFDHDASLKFFPPSIRGLGIQDLPIASFSLLLPYVNQLRELDLVCLDHVEQHCQCFLFERCPNLEVLRTDDVCEDLGFRVIGQFCKKLRKLTHHGQATSIGLISLVQGCTSLEYLDVEIYDISNEAFECVGAHLKSLDDFRMKLAWKGTNLPLDNGIRAMLEGCIKLRKLTLDLWDEDLTDVGMGYIGKYGHNLRYLYLRCKGGVSDAGLVELSKGCPRLRKLYFCWCPFGDQAVATFVFNIHSLRYVWVEKDVRNEFALTRPTFTAQVLRELTTQYVKLAEKLHKLAVQLVADGSGLGSVEITYTSSRATDNLDTPLVRAMLAKGISINGGEQVIIVDASSLEIIKVQIGEIKVEGRVKDGVPHLTKVGVLDVNVSLEGNIILCRQAPPHQPNFITTVLSILEEEEENVTINSMSFGKLEQYKILVIGVDEKPSIEALNKIDDISDFVFLAF